MIRQQPASIPSPKIVLKSFSYFQRLCVRACLCVCVCVRYQCTTGFSQFFLRLLRNILSLGTSSKHFIRERIFLIWRSSFFSRCFCTQFSSFVSCQTLFYFDLLALFLFSPFSSFQVFSRITIETVLTHAHTHTHSPARSHSPFLHLSFSFFFALIFSTFLFSSLSLASRLLFTAHTRPRKKNVCRKK